MNILKGLLLFCCCGSIIISLSISGFLSKHSSINIKSCIKGSLIGSALTATCLIIYFILIGQVASVLLMIIAVIEILLFTKSYNRNKFKNKKND